MKQETSWLIIANSSLARVYQLENKKKVTEIQSFEHPESRLHNRDLVSDRPGRDFESQGATRHALMPKVMPKKQETITFANQLSEFLEKERLKGTYQGLYIAANPALLGILRQSLNPNTAKLIKGEVDKDMTQLKPHEITDSLPFFA